MSTRWVVAALALSIVLSAPLAHADCATPPSYCYCRSAAFVLDGHVETVATDYVSLRVDSINQASSFDGSPPAAGTLVDIASEHFYSTVQIGDRLLVSYDAAGQALTPVTELDDSGNVFCSGQSASAVDAASWMVLDSGACQKAVDQRFGKYQCDDTATTCAVASPRPSRSDSPIALMALGAALAVVRRTIRRARRSES